MTIALLDVNVLIALAWPNHVHHGVATAWFRGLSGPWATCSITQCGFVRVSSNRRVLPEAKQPAEAVLQLRRMVAVGDHGFLRDDVAIADSRFFELERVVGHRLVTDAQLLAIARRHEGRVVTLDRGLAALAPSDLRTSLVELIDPRS